MATQWFYRQGTEQIGPISANQLRTLAQAGTIKPNSSIRKDDSDWMKASRIKGLFDSVDSTPENENGGDRDPLVALSSQAASSVVFAAGSAASAVSGAVSGWFAGREEKKTELTTTSDQSNWLDTLTRDNQSPDIVRKVAEKVTGILMSGEQLTYVAVQSKPLVNWMPDCIALTNKRLIFYHARLLGRVDFEDCVWRDLHDAKLSENIIGSTFSVKTADGRTLSLDYLPKSQARAVYRFAQEMEELSLEERRTRSLEEKRAQAGGVVLQTHVASPAAQSSLADPNDPMEKLKKLKSIADAGLISSAEYEAKKAEILSRM